MNVDSKLEELLTEARAALAALNSHDSSVAGLVARVSSLRYTEGTLVGFLDALALADPLAAQRVAPKIESLVSEAIAARLLLK